MFHLLNICLTHYIEFWRGRATVCLENKMSVSVCVSYSVGQRQGGGVGYGVSSQDIFSKLFPSPEEYLLRPLSHTKSMEGAPSV